MTDDYLLQPASECPKCQATRYYGQCPNCSMDSELRIELHRIEERENPPKIEDSVERCLRCGQPTGAGGCCHYCCGNPDCEICS